MKKTKYLHVDGYLAEIDVELIEGEKDSGWGPYLSIDDALLLDDIKELLRKGDIAKASKKARVYSLTPVATGDA